MRTVPRSRSATTFAIQPKGRFDLRRSATFGFGQREAAAFTGLMRLAFCLDGYEQHIGVVVRQDRPDGELTGEVSPTTTPADPAAVAEQVARVLSLDHDSRTFDSLVAADPLLGPLATAAPGLRPPLFHSAYEAAAWSVLSARGPYAQMARLRRQLAEAYGTVFDLAGERVAAFPTPAQLLGVSDFPGVPAVKLTRLHAIARAALDGLLDTAALRELPPPEAGTRLRRLPGIGPFYADLIVVRALGHTDAIPGDEPRVRNVLADLLGRAAVSQPEYEAIAEAWRPWRTWATVLVRAIGTERARR